tara:strand:+ start:972 stop:1106 length:135 start_codon:yes stop_codon:yes gene_type:complete
MEMTEEKKLTSKQLLDVMKDTKHAERLLDTIQKDKEAQGIDPKK